jgi:large subunit ribosomal protein L25
MAAKPNPIEVAKSLPPTLLRFFARYPPNPLVFNPPRVPPASSGSSTTSPGGAQPTPPAATASTQWPNNRHLTSWHALKPGAAAESGNSSSSAYNPFLPWRDPSGRWRSPRFGLRRQALLCRLARAHGVESLLPWSAKRADVRAERRERGLRVRGTGAGMSVKGHKHERRLAGKLEARRQAMLGMPALIREWKIVSFCPEAEGRADWSVEGTWEAVEEVAQEGGRPLIKALLTNYIIIIHLFAFLSSTVGLLCNACSCLSLVIKYVLSKQKNYQGRSKRLRRQYTRLCRTQSFSVCLD